MVEHATADIIRGCSEAYKQCYIDENSSSESSDSSSEEAASDGEGSSPHGSPSNIHDDALTPNEEPSTTNDDMCPIIPPAASPPCPLSFSAHPERNNSPGNTINETSTVTNNDILVCETGNSNDGSKKQLSGDESSSLVEKTK